MIIDTDLSLSGMAPAIGLLGAGVYLTSYTLLQTGVLRGRSYTYASLVIVAASCVAISTIGSFNPAVLIMQSCYIAISIVGIARLFVMSRMLRHSPEERAFVRQHLPDLRPEHVRPLLRQGRWIDIGANETLARQGEPLARLYFLAEGEAKVIIDGKPVGTCHECFVGELTLLTGEGATATVITATPCRVLVFEAPTLRRLLRREADIRLALISGFTTATRALLLRRNREAMMTEPPDA